MIYCTFKWCSYSRKDEPCWTCVVDKERKSCPTRAYTRAFERAQHDPLHKCESSNEMRKFYKVDNKVYSIIQGMFDTWIKAKLQVGKAASNFSLKVKAYIQWIIAQSTAKDFIDDYPWKVLSVSLGFKGRYFMARHIVHPIPIGLCNLDTTKGVASMIQWTADKLLDFLRGIMDTTEGFSHQQFFFLSF